MNKCIGRRRRRCFLGRFGFFSFFFERGSGRWTVRFYSIELNSPSMVSSLETFVVRTKPILSSHRLFLLVVAPRALVRSRLVCLYSPPRPEKINLPVSDDATPRVASSIAMSDARAPR